MATILGMNNFNIYGNSLSGLLGSSSGTGILGNFGMFGNNSIFTNCFGEPNYGAITGFETTKALAGVVGWAIESNIKSKEPEVNYTEEIKNTNKDIDNIQDEVTKKLTEVTTLDGKISDADKEISALNTKLSSAETTYNNAKEALLKADKNSTEYDILKDEYDKAKEAYEKTIPEEIKAQEEIKEKAIEEKNKLNTEIAELQDEIEELQDKKADFQKASDAKTIKTAKSMGWQRADEACIKDWQEASSEKQATEKELRRAIYEYKHAETDDAKKEAALAVKNMFESNEDGLKDFKCIYEAVKREQNL